jgi:hypothetical protein
MLNTATQVYLLMHVLLFLSAIKVALAHKGILKIIIVASAALGLIGIAIALVVSFALPSSLQFGSQISYAMYSGLFLLFMILIPLLPKLFSPKSLLIVSGTKSPSSGAST